MRRAGLSGPTSITLARNEVSGIEPLSLQALTIKRLRATAKPNDGADPCRHLQGWRLFAEAHKVQAGDQVAFELVTKNRLVAQIIKHSDGTQLPKAPKATGVKRKAATGPRAPRSVFQRSVSHPWHTAA